MNNHKTSPKNSSPNKLERDTWNYLDFYDIGFDACNNCYSIKMTDRGKPNHTTIFNFSSRENALLWLEATRQIRLIAANINEIGSLKKRNKLWKHWLIRAEEFRICWSDHHVPGDIKWAVQDVQKALNLPLTEY